MFGDTSKKWRDGVFLCHTQSSFQADLLESKLKSEGIPCVKKYEGASNFIEITMGSNTSYAIDIYVPEDRLEDARNVIVPVDLDDCEEVDFDK